MASGISSRANSAPQTLQRSATRFQVRTMFKGLPQRGQPTDAVFIIMDPNLKD